MSQQIHMYTELRQKIHDDLRLQHPEWVQPNGESPICDSYDARFRELIDRLTRTGVERGQHSQNIVTGIICHRAIKAGWSRGCDRRL